MKIMVTLNVKGFIDEYNKYAKSFNFLTMEAETVYIMLDKIYGGVTYVKGKPEYVIMSATELETLAGLLDVEGWGETAMDNALHVWFLR